MISLSKTVAHTPGSFVSYSRVLSRNRGSDPGVHPPLQKKPLLGESETAGVGVLVFALVSAFDYTVPHNVYLHVVSN